MTNEMLAERIRGGFSVSENMQSLYEGNLPLIRKFIKPFTAYECEADLLQESCFGLVAAVQHYEISENVRFMTYARYWILLAVQQYIEKCGSAVRIPNYERQKIIRCKPILTWKMIRQIFYAEYAKNALWGIVARYTDIRENGIIKEIFLHGKTMAQAAGEQGITIERVRQIKEKGLRKLKTGRARRELLEKFDIAGAGLYRGGLNNYREHGFTSVVERTAMKEIEAEEHYKQRLRGIEERYKERMALSGRKS